MGDRPRTRRRPGLLELIALAATVVPCCLATFAFFGVESVPGLWRDDTPEPPPTAALTVATPPVPTATPAVASTQPAAAHPGSDAFEAAGEWTAQFHDVAFAEVSDYVLELSRTGRDLSGTATAISPGNPHCQSRRPVRGQVDMAARTLVLTETLGGSTTCPTFPRGSAGDLKTFTLTYDMAGGVPSLQGIWQEVYASAWERPGDITFYRQP